MTAGPVLAQQAPAESERAGTSCIFGGIGRTEADAATGRVRVREARQRTPTIGATGERPGDGWFPIPNTNTDLRFGGFVQLNVIHDFEDTGFPFGDFIPAQIPVPTDDTPNTEFDVRTSRLTFESRRSPRKRAPSPP